jgi:predicted lipoprotein with Yx(FWY)xxD motif
MERKWIYKALLPFVVTATFASASGAYAADLVAKIGSSSLGKIVVNGQGMSAYFFDLDRAKSGVSSCTGKCSARWPAILSSTTKPRVSGIKGAIGSIALKNGSRQVTINGRPIYTFVLDKAAGEIKGQGAQALWYVISPSGAEIKIVKIAAKLAPAAATPTPVAKARY